MGDAGIKYYSIFEQKIIFYRVADQFSLKNNHKSVRFNFFIKHLRILVLYYNCIRTICGHIQPVSDVSVVCA